MMERFQIDDRVMLVVTFVEIPQGALGSIIQIVPAACEIYEVRFDDHPTVRPVLVTASFLAHAPSEADHDTI